MELCATLFLLFNELNFSQDGMRQLCHASENNTLRRNVCALDVLSCTHIHYTHAHMCTPLPHLQHMHPNPSQEAHILFLLHFPKTSSFFFFFCCGNIVSIHFFLWANFMSLFSFPSQICLLSGWGRRGTVHAGDTLIWTTSSPGLASFSKRPW